MTRTLFVWARMNFCAVSIYSVYQLSAVSTWVRWSIYALLLTITVHFVDAIFIERKRVSHAGYFFFYEMPELDIKKPRYLKYLQFH